MLQAKFLHPAFILGFILSVTIPAAAAPGSISPVRSLVYTGEEIQAVRKQAESDPLMKEVAQEFIRDGTKWTAMTEEEIRKLIPPVNAVFAYGFAGDPITNRPWPRLGKDICSLDRPFEVVSPFDHAVYGTQAPGEKFYDDGNGWVREDGRRFYFKGIWNTYIVRTLHRAVDQLATSYMLTGEPAFAERALFILDALATLRSHRPASDGPIDFPGPPKNEYGFFSYFGNLANERMLASALAFDLVGGAPSASLPSLTNAKLTCFENIRQNYFSVFGEGLIKNGGSFHNHAVSAYASSIAQGLLFGEPEKVIPGMEACYGFLNNALDRDGEYYEVSTSYGDLGRLYGGRMLSLFNHYNRDRYPDSAGFPPAENYPYHLRFGNDPTWYKAAVTSLYSLTTLSRPSQYGNTGPDRFTPEPTTTTVPFVLGASRLVSQRVMFLKLFYSQTDHPLWKEICSKLYWSLPRQARNNKGFLIQGILQYGPSQWVQPPKPENLDLPPFLQERFSTVTGQKRIAILRSGEGKHQRALFMRGGAGNQHAHDDQMATTLYSNGMALTGEYGYSLYGTPDHRGYGTQAVAHQTVIPDEGGPRNFGASYPSARIEGYLPFGPAQLIEMANPSLWPVSRLSEYRRQAWMVEISEEEGYFVDFFWVNGGRKHDYVWTAPYLSPSRDDALKWTGVTPAPIAGVWSLAGLNPDYRTAVFNQPGKSWGERLDVGTGTIRSLEDDEKKLPVYYWTPPPGNGYGFIWDIKAASVAHPWSATWLLHDLKHSMRMTMLTDATQTVITGKAPSLRFGSHHDVVIARREATDGAPLKSLFTSVTQTGIAEKWPLKKIESLKGLRAGDGGILISQQDGTEDLLFALETGAKTSAAGVRLEGKHGFVRRTAGGNVVLAVLNEGTHLGAGEIGIRLSKANWTGHIKAVEKEAIVLDTPLPDQGQLRGHPVFFSSSPDAATPYASNEFFTVESVLKSPDEVAILKFDHQSVVAGRLKIEEKKPSGELVAAWANELAAVLLPNADHARVFGGHMIRREGDAKSSALITSYQTKKSFTVDNPEAIVAGNHYDLFAVAPGDSFRIPSFAILKQVKEGSWTIKTNMDVELRLMKKKADWIFQNGSDPERTIQANQQGWITLPVEWLTEGSGTLTRVSTH